MHMQQWHEQLFHSRNIFLGVVLLAAGLLGGCGNGGPIGNETSTSGTSTSTTNTGTTAGAAGIAGAAIQLLVSSPQMPSSGAIAVDLTAVVLDANKQTVKGRTVTFYPGTDTSAFISSVSGVTDSNGVATAKLNLGTNKVNRTITVTATADFASSTNSIDVTGTAITVSGNDSLAFGGSTTLTFSLKDSAGTPLPGIAMSLTSKNGNTILMTPATGITNNSGQISAIITTNTPGNDVIAAKGGGTSTTKALSVNSANFAFSTPNLAAPSASIDIPLTPTKIAITWNDAAAGGPQPGKLIAFASSRGTISGSPAITDATGTASVTVTSPLSSGPAIITASGPNSTPVASLNVVFVATEARNITVQAIPSTIQTTTTAASQTTNNATITAVVRDSNGNVVKNAGVNFSVTKDPSGGSLTSARALTDDSGSASVTYAAGIISSPQNGVEITATVSDVNGAASSPTISNTATLTVTGQSLNLRLGTDNIISSSPSSTLLHVKKYIAIVTDSGGNPVSGVNVRFVLGPGRYFKGGYAPAIAATFNADGSLKTPEIPATQSVIVGCPNEDTNFNNFLDPGEDTNQNGRLDPGGIASVSPTATTDSNGVATAAITYPKSYATWVEVILEARTGVSGNDPPALATFVLPIAVEDLAFGGAASLASTSPYGTSTSCSNTQ